MIGNSLSEFLVKLYSIPTILYHNVKTVEISKINFRFQSRYYNDKNTNDIFAYTNTKKHCGKSLFFFLKKKSYT